jgi:hypothetical protein
LCRGIEMAEMEEIMTEVENTTEAEAMTEMADDVRKERQASYNAGYMMVIWVG